MLPRKQRVLMKHSARQLGRSALVHSDVVGQPHPSMEFTFVENTSRWTAALRSIESQKSEGCRLIHDPLSKYFSNDHLQVFKACMGVELTEEDVARVVHEYGSQGKASLTPDQCKLAVLVDRLAVRSIWIDTCILDAARQKGRPCQVVSLGAGLCSRPWRLPAVDMGHIHYFEIDTKSVLGYKKNIIQHEKAQMTCAEYSCVTADVCDVHSWAIQLLEAGFNPRHRTVWVAEGLSGYLTVEANVKVIHQIRLMSSPGSQAIYTFNGVSDKLTNSHKLCTDEPADFIVHHLGGFARGRQTSLFNEASRHGRATYMEITSRVEEADRAKYSKACNAAGNTRKAGNYWLVRAEILPSPVLTYEDIESPFLYTLKNEFFSRHQHDQSEMKHDSLRMAIRNTFLHCDGLCMAPAFVAFYRARVWQAAVEKGKNTCSLESTWENLKLSKGYMRPMLRSLSLVGIIESHDGNALTVTESCNLLLQHAEDISLLFDAVRPVSVWRQYLQWTVGRSTSGSFDKEQSAVLEDLLTRCAEAVKRCQEAMEGSDEMQLILGIALVPIIVSLNQEHGRVSFVDVVSKPLIRYLNNCGITTAHDVEVLSTLALVYGLPASYIPTLKAIPQLLYNCTPAHVAQLLWTPLESNTERHIDRALNVSSTSQMVLSRYSGLDDGVNPLQRHMFLVLDQLFNSTPVESQPLWVCDVGTYMDSRYPPFKLFRFF